MTVVELVGLPASGKSTVAEELADRHIGVRTTMTDLDHSVTRPRRAIRRIGLVVRCMSRHPVWSVTSLVRLVRSGQPGIGRAIRLWPNLLVPAALVERARSRGTDELLDQGTAQFVVSAGVDADRPLDFDAVVPIWRVPTRSSNCGSTSKQSPAGSTGVSAVRARTSRPVTERSFSTDSRPCWSGSPSTRWSTLPRRQRLTRSAVPFAMTACTSITSSPGSIGEVLSRTRCSPSRASAPPDIASASCSGVSIDFEAIWWVARRRAGAEEIPLTNLRQEMNPVRDVLAFVQLVRVLRRRRPDVVHTHSSKAGVIGRAAARVARVPVVVHTVHGWSFHGHQSRVERGLAILAERVGARMADAIVILAENDRAKGRAARIGSPDDYRLIRSGIDLAPFRKAREGRDEMRASVLDEFGLDDDTRLVGSVTRLSDQKDPITLLEAASRIVAQRPDVVFLVVGDGPLEATVRSRRQELGLEEQVQLLGNRGDVARLVASFDVFLLTSRWEGLPRVVPEAMAAGTPVVATDVDGTSEIVRDGDTGRLIPAGDPERAAEAVLDLLLHHERADGLASRAVEVVPAWDARKMVDRLEGLYRSSRARSLSGGPSQRSI